jgi:hypothetical protein
MKKKLIAAIIAALVAFAGGLGYYVESGGTRSSATEVPPIVQPDE